MSSEIKNSWQLPLHLLKSSKTKDHSEEGDRAPELQFIENHRGWNIRLRSSSPTINLTLNFVPKHHIYMLFEDAKEEKKSHSHFYMCIFPLFLQFLNLRTYPIQHLKAGA